ncbi:MAG: serine/threonine-protein kinase [Kofleriaceae bacterium]
MNPREASIAVGDYQLEGRIGEGGSGQVYRARRGDQIVALKILGPASDLDDAARARFTREIATLSQIDHPNLVAMIDHGIDAELGPYLVLPLLAGTNLRSLVGGRVCPEAATLLMQPVIAAVAALHAAGYVHRDLKPENVIAAPDGTVTVIDLGLAWREGMTRHTDTGAAVGSVGYMAPEQIEGRAVDPKADVWALGVMIYELVAGKRPFARPRPAEEAAAALLGQCPKLTAADRRTGDVFANTIARCFELDPAKRPTAAELLASLQIDWTDQADQERAAAIADPVGYVARVAPFRVRRIERTAREAIDRGAAFEALALCDRGLAYSPDDPALLALVRDAESGAARTPVVKPKKIWPWIAGAVAGITAIGVIAKLTSSPAPDPWGASTSTTSAPVAPATSQMTDGDRKMMGNFISVFGRAMDRRDGTATPDSDRALAKDMVGMFGEVMARGGGGELKITPDPYAGQRIPTSVRGWLERAGNQEPADALISVRKALEIDPDSADAHQALCIMLAANHDTTAIAECDKVLTGHPSDGYALAARGRAKLDAGDTVGGKADLAAACKVGKKTACESK